MRAAAYARVSSQAQRERHTIENQLRALPAFIAAQGWTLVDTYVDDGRSAKAGKLEAREGFARLVRDADAKRFDVVVVVDIDRLTRTDDLEERARILGPFQRNNIQIVTPSGGALDLRTMLGELYVTMQALVAAEENRKRAERIKSGKARAIAEGRKPAGPTPYGLRYSRATGQWSIDPERAAVVAEIFERVIAGESCVTIAMALDARGAPVMRSRPWSREPVYRIVRSGYAKGEWLSDKRRHLTVKVPAIVSPASWQAAQDKLIECGRRGLRRTKHVYLLEGLGRCGRCGSAMLISSATPARGGRIDPSKYICRSRKFDGKGTPSRCTADLVKTAEADARVWTAVSAELDDPALASELQRRAEAQSANRRDWAADADGYRKHLDRLDRVEATVLERFRRGAVSDRALDVELAALGRERAAVQAQLDVAKRALAARDEDIGDPSAWLASMRELAATATPEERRRIVQAIVEPRSVVFDGQRIRLTLLVEAGSRAGADAAEPVLAVVPG